MEADRARTDLLAAYQAGGKSLGDVLVCTGRQTDETLAFLGILTDYNRTLAEYVLAVLPANVPGEKLIDVLIAAREKKAELQTNGNARMGG